MGGVSFWGPCLLRNVRARETECRTLNAESPTQAAQAAGNLRKRASNDQVMSGILLKYLFCVRCRGPWRGWSAADNLSWTTGGGNRSAARSRSASAARKSENSAPQFSVMYSKWVAKSSNSLFRAASIATVGILRCTGPGDCNRCNLATGRTNTGGQACCECIQRFVTQNTSSSFAGCGARCRCTSADSSAVKSSRIL